MTINPTIKSQTTIGTHALVHERTANIESNAEDSKANVMKSSSTTATELAKFPKENVNPIATIQEEGLTSKSCHSQGGENEDPT